MRETASTAAEETAVLGAIDALVDYARARLLLDPRDVDWMRNRLLEVLGADEARRAEAAALRLTESDDAAASGDAANPDDIAATDDASRKAAAAFLDDDVIMGALSAAPSRIQDAYDDVRAGAGNMAAMRWFYDYGVANGYIKLAQLRRNVRFDGAGLVVTINTAKPEFKDMRKATSGNSVDGSFAQCTICHANEGLAARGKRTLRTVEVELDGRPWFWQFSPYGYFAQHGICVNREHTPMHVDRSTFANLLDFVNQFPDYFLGCNAALPRIGGSVLAHDHYQGGGETMPMQRAAAWRRYRCPDADDAVLEIIDWPASAMRVRSRNRAAIVQVCERIREAWACYDDAALGIASHDAAGAAQSSLSPIARLVSGEDGAPMYEMSLILRNNAVSGRYPLGVFHAHPEYFFVKQEPIGLIEAMGLFVLPGRLVGQLGALEDALVAGDALPDGLAEFRLLWDEVREALRQEGMGAADRGMDRDTVRRAVRDALADVCRRILDNIAVFPNHEELGRFLEGLGFEAQDC